MPRKSTTRAAQGSGSIRQRPDGRWEARYTVGRDPGTGKQVRKSIYGDTQAEVRKQLAAVIRDIDECSYTDPSKITVGAWLDEWAENYLGSVKASTVEQYKYQIRVHLKPSIGAVRLQSLAAPVIQKMYNQKLHNGLSPKSIRNVNGVLHSAMMQALKLGMIRVNPCDAVTLPRVEKKEIKPLDASQIQAFMQAIAGHKYEYFFLVDLFTGLRQAELIGLTWDCVDMKNNTITVYRQLRKERKKGGQYKFGSLKNDKQRTITVAPFVMDILCKVRKKQCENMLLLGADFSNPNNFVFTNEFGGHLSANSSYESFKLVCRKMGLPETRFHDLRHTFATLSLMNGDDIKTVQENLGHATPTFTLSVYAHATEQMKQASANRMESFIQSCKG